MFPCLSFRPDYIICKTCLIIIIKIVWRCSVWIEGGGGPRSLQSPLLGVVCGLRVEGEPPSPVPTTRLHIWTTNHHIKALLRSASVALDTVQGNSRSYASR